MLHNVDLILTLAGGLSAALVLGFITQKLRMSPIVGYLLAGIIVGPYSPGFVADADTASQCAEIGIIQMCIRDSPDSLFQGHPPALR